MDPQSLSQLFATTYNADPNVRKAAELQIRKEGMLTSLMQVAGADSVDVSVRLACAVYLKNRIRRAYFIEPGNPLPDQSPIPASDRDQLRANILPLLVTAPNRAIRTPLAEALRSLISNDFPERWPSLLDDIKVLLQSARVPEVVAGCVAMLELVKAFRYRHTNDLTHTLVPQVFPILVNIALQLLSAPPAPLTPESPEIPTLLHIILKTYKHSIGQSLSPHQQTAESIVPWGRLLFQVVGLHIPKDLIPADEDARESCEWWKAKKWAYGCLNRLFTRYGNPSQLPTAHKKDYAVFAAHFISAFAPEIFKMYLAQVDHFIQHTEWMSRKAQFLILSFFSECVKPRSTWMLLKPHFATLVSSFVFPHLCFTPENAALWEGDPIEFARMSIDEYEDYSSPVSSATFFLLGLVSGRPKTTFMPVLNFINSALGGAAPQQRYGALRMISVLAPHMIRNASVRENLAPFLRRHVLPEFSSVDGFMRNIACDVVNSVEKHEFDWPSKDELAVHYAAVLHAMDDPALPVRIQAALALSEMIKRHELVRKALAGSVGKLVQDLLKMCDETDMDVLNSCMESIVEHFHDELLPVAAQLTARLCESYRRLMQSETTEDAEDDADMSLSDVDTGAEDKTFAAMGVAKTLRTIIGSMDGSRDILLKVQDHIIPIIVETLGRQSVQAVELYDNMFELVDGLTFTLRAIAPELWPAFELTYARFKSNSSDFLDEMLPSLENFMTWGADVFAARADYRAMVLDIYVSAMDNEHLGAADRCNASKLIEALLLNLRGHVDDTLETIVRTALRHLQTPDQVRSARLANLQVLVNCVLYNAGGALALFDGAGAARAVFDKWFAAVRAEGGAGVPRVHDKKLSILAMCALLKLPPAAVPPALAEGWAHIVPAVLTLFRDLPAAVAKREALQAAFENDSDSEEDEDEETQGAPEENEDEEGDVWDQDSAYLDFLAKEAAALRSKREGDESGESDSDDGDDVEEELGYISPLEGVNPYVAFKDALTAFQMQNASAYAAGTTALDLELKALLMDVMKIADSGDAAMGA